MNEQKVSLEFVIDSSGRMIEQNSDSSKVLAEALYYRKYIAFEHKRLQENGTYSTIGYKMTQMSEFSFENEDDDGDITFYARLCANSSCIKHNHNLVGILNAEMLPNDLVHISVQRRC